MIIATRIPSLTKQMYAATLAAQARRDAGLPDAPALRLVRRLERLGYAVRIERMAA